MTRPAPAVLRVFIVFAVVAGILAGIAQPWTAPAGGAQDGATIGDAPVYDPSVPQPSSDGEVQAAGSGVSVDISNRQAVVDFYYSEYVNAPKPASNWSGNVSQCNAGTTSNAYKQAVLRRINFYRAMSGVPTDTVINTIISAKAQQAALIMSAAGSLSHEPDSTWPCYSTDGDEAAGSSNLMLGASGWEAVDVYMSDPGPNNGPVGHRRWILYPQSRKFGTGDIVDPQSSSSTNALWVVDRDTYSDPRPATRENFVAWPPPGYVPYDLVFARWSFSYSDANFANASITLKRGSTTVPVAVEHRSSGGPSYGEESIVWHPTSGGYYEPLPDPTSDTPYTIQVNDVIIDGVSRDFSYTVILIDPASDGGPAPTATGVSAPRPSCTTSPTSGIVTTRLTMTCSKFLPGETVTAHWDNTTTTVLASTTANSSGRATLSFKIPNSTKGVHQAVAKGNTGGRTARNPITVIPSITLKPTSGGVGSSVSVTMRGFGKREVVNVSFYLSSTNPKTVASNFTLSSTGTGVVAFSVPRVYLGSHKVRVAGNAGSQVDSTFRISASTSSLHDPTRTAVPTRTADATRTPVPAATATNTATPQPTATSTPTLEPTATATATEVPVEQPPDEAPQEAINGEDIGADDAET
jgi:hypothetical protein